MLKQENRLTKKADFNELYKKGHIFFTANLKIIYLKQKNELSRVGIVTSLKVNKRAVVRNRIKRKIRALIEKRIDQFSGSYDIIFYIKPKIREEDIEKLPEGIIFFLNKRKIV